MTGRRWALLGLVFLAELLAWAGCGAIVFVWLDGPLAWLLAALVVAAVIGCWAVFMAPRASHPLPVRSYYLVKGLVYAFAILAWALVLWPLAVALAAMVAISEPFLARDRLRDPAA